jgi:hypothetical protein
MANSEYSFFSSFPSRQHVEEVCKFGKGEEVCRYLVFGGEGFGCAKANPLRETIDKRSEAGTMGAKGDNCEGTAGFIKDNKERLVGSKVKYQEIMPSMEAEGILEDISVDEKNVGLSAGRASMGISESYAQIDIEPDGIRFSTRGLGAFAGESKILFKRT